MQEQKNPNHDGTRYSPPCNGVDRVVVSGSRRLQILVDKLDFRLATAVSGTFPTFIEEVLMLFLAMDINIYVSCADCNAALKTVAIVRHDFAFR